MKIGLVGPSYQMQSLPFDAQRSVNLFPVVDETRQGKEISAMQGTPGLATFTTAGSGAIRGEFASSNGRAFVVSGAELYEIDSVGTVTLRGSLDTIISAVTIEENPTQMAICDGLDIWVFTYTTNAFIKVTLPFTPALTIGSLNGYLIANTSNGKFYISSAYDWLTWSALESATAESSPDGLLRVIGALGQAWMFGATTTEVWSNTADLDFPFDRIDGARMEVGVAAPYSVLYVDNTLVWIGQTKEGRGIVYKAAGYSPQRISTHAIEYTIRKAGDLSDIRAYAYQEDGHLFYVLTGGNLPTSLVYDFSTDQWHERAYLESSGFYSSHLGLTYMYAFGKHLLGSKVSGKIYEMHPDYYDDDGQEIRAERIFTHINNEGKPIFASSLQVDFEYGVGLASGQGADPKVWLSISTDGGRTFGNEYQASIGKIGAYKTRTSWRRLGMTDNQMTFKIAITDPVKRFICGAYLF